MFYRFPQDYSLPVKKECDMTQNTEDDCDEITYLMVYPDEDVKWKREYENLQFFEKHIISIEKLSLSLFPTIEVLENENGMQCFKRTNKASSSSFSNKSSSFSKRFHFSLFQFIKILEEDVVLTKFLDSHNKCFPFSTIDDISPNMLLQKCVDIDRCLHENENENDDDDDDDDENENENETLKPLSYDYVCHLRKNVGGGQNINMSAFVEYRKRCLQKTGYFSETFLARIFRAELRWISHHHHPSLYADMSKTWNGEFMAIRHLHLFFHTFRNSHNEIPSSPPLLRGLLRGVLTTIFCNYREEKSSK